MVNHLVVTLNGSQQNLGVYALAAGFPVDLLKAVWLSANGSNANPIYVGGRGANDVPLTVSSTNYGFRIEAAVAGIPPAPSIVESSQGIASLTDFVVIGTNAQKLHVLMIR